MYENCGESNSNLSYRLWQIIEYNFAPDAALILTDIKKKALTLKPDPTFRASAYLTALISARTLHARVQDFDQMRKRNLYKLDDAMFIPQLVDMFDEYLQRDCGVALTLLYQYRRKLMLQCFLVNTASVDKIEDQKSEFVDCKLDLSSESGTFQLEPLMTRLCQIESRFPTGPAMSVSIPESHDTKSIECTMFTNVKPAIKDTKIMDSSLFHTDDAADATSLTSFLGVDWNETANPAKTFSRIRGTEIARRRSRFVLC